MLRFQAFQILDAHPAHAADVEVYAYLPKVNKQAPEERRIRGLGPSHTPALAPKDLPFVL